MRHFFENGSSRFAVVLGLTVFGAALRLPGSGFSLWIDELHTAWTITGTAAEVVPRATIGNQSPLYFALLWAWTSLVGVSEWTLRLPSLGAGILLIPGTYLVALRWTGLRGAACVAAALVALDDNCIFYSQEARPYVFVQGLGLLHLALFWHCLRQPHVELRIGLVLCGALLFYFHYTAALLLVAEFFYYGLLVALGRVPNYRPAHVLLDAVLIASACLPALTHLQEIVHRRQQWAMFIPQTSWDAIFTIFHAALYAALPLAVMLAMTTYKLSLQDGTARLSFDPDLATMILCWFFVPVALAWAFTNTDVARLFFQRYLIATALAPIFAVVIGLQAIPSGYARALLSGLVLLASVVEISPLPRMLVERTPAIDLRKENWRAAVQYVRQSHGESPVLIRSGLIEADLLRESDNDLLHDYTLLPVQSIYRLDAEPELLLPLPTTNSGLLNEEQRARLARHRDAWLIARGRPAAVDRTVSELLMSVAESRAAGRVVERRRFGGVEVVRIAFD